jgi:ABC-type transport system involved in multi-copper enzyme maturation permease subunit
MAVTVMITLIIAAVGGGVSSTNPSDQVGMIVFHTFFSLAFFVVTWLGPALAANAISSEREGRTWEAVVLTVLRPQVIARGKFLAAFTSIGTYIVMIAPVGALPFLFGGVHPAEVMIAFVYLFIFALLSVAFGLAISSKMINSRGAIVLTLMLAVPMSAMVYGLGGPLTAKAVHQLWDRVNDGAPVWLPTAYVRGRFGPEYVALLFGLPALAVILPAWFLYEATVANLAGGNDDRSSGMKRWYVVTALVLAITCAIAVVPIPYSGDQPFTIGSLSGLFVFGAFSAFVFAGEPLGVSRRVTYAWDRDGVGPVRRFLGPGIINAGKLQFGVGLFAFALVALVGINEVYTPPAGPYVLAVDPGGIARFALFAAGYFAFIVGLTTFLRARSQTPGNARILLLVILAALAVVPWIVMAMVGAMARGDDTALIVASPSPFFAFVLVQDHLDSLIYGTGYVASAVLALLGVFLHTAGARKVHAVIADFEDRLAKAEAKLEAEDAALDAAAMGEEPPPSSASPTSTRPSAVDGASAGAKDAAEQGSDAAPKSDVEPAAGASEAAASKPDDA